MKTTEDINKSSCCCRRAKANTQLPEEIKVSLPVLEPESEENKKTKPWSVFGDIYWI